MPLKSLLLDFFGVADVLGGLENRVQLIHERLNITRSNRGAVRLLNALLAFERGEGLSVFLQIASSSLDLGDPIWMFLHQIRIVLLRFVQLINDCID